ncbi:hypothetical protein [Amycolatopsis palatopharyngis]|uniref:hypothetical protein n=1 Tax=Amycolatopsis palatopharyngis TaxID=187982 RepID=UPI000E251684|nr:hypothetical protein [Amycolatopsis palatopharyngis]
MAERSVTPGSGFAADPDRLRACAGDFDDLAGRAESIATELAGMLASGSQAGSAPWGDDEIGRAFAAVHVEGAASARERIEGLPDELAAMGGRFAGAAEAYRAADDTAAGDVSGAGAGD